MTWVQVSLTRPTPCSSQRRSRNTGLRAGRPCRSSSPARLNVTCRKPWGKRLFFFGDLRFRSPAKWSQVAKPEALDTSLPPAWFPTATETFTKGSLSVSDVAANSSETAVEPHASCGWVRIGSLGKPPAHFERVPGVYCQASRFIFATFSF